MKTLTSIFMIGLAGFLAIKNRYRILNLLLGSGFTRRLFVGSILSMPGVRDKMMQTMFSRPAAR
ncbi:hypothetical protein HHO41_16225 [Bacillus sp. DNRA2]|uniref:hypothetical protein n=1 Tax=Bacillus sp. DNRA2 TaxID=2723053 RepID=UPI00145DD054|nr:hypothetical protein [Bacillus sp. DNRA2]NMD71846.1 hypothetical protein [Bacillus sp. DNRA2]